jgi:hypothetical protein
LESTATAQNTHNLALPAFDDSKPCVCKGPESPPVAEMQRETTVLTDNAVAILSTEITKRFGFR